MDDGIRKSTWEGLLDAEQNVLYWESLIGFYKNYDKAVQIFLAIVLFGNIGTWWILKTVPGLLTFINALSGVFAIISPFLNISDNLREMTDLHSKWTDLSGDYRELFNSTLTGGNADAGANLAELRRTGSELDKRRVAVADIKWVQRRCARSVLERRGVTVPSGWK